MGPAYVMTGPIEFLRACLKITRVFLRPLARAVADVILTQYVQHGGALQARDISHGIQGKGQRREHHAAGLRRHRGRPAKPQGEDDEQQGGNHKGRHAHQGGSDHLNDLIQQFPALERRERA